MDIRQRSIEVIQGNQFDSGAYIASPSFVHYRYSWLRDGTFIAYSMNRVGEHESADRFYQWCADVVLQHEKKARRAITLVQVGESLDENDFLHTRYTVAGEEVEGHWGNFQLDGYGTWLWGLDQHLTLTQSQDQFVKYQQAVELTIDYLVTCWQLPNYDCWEEFGDRIHPASLAAIYGGLHAMIPYLPHRAVEIETACRKIQSFVMEHGVVDGVFIKSFGNPSVDSSLLWLALPFHMVPLEDPIFTRTVEKIETHIVSGYGVHRYPEDVYYGGGQWILLSAWLGWYYAKTGSIQKAQEILTWIESKCSELGLPEQVFDHLLSPVDYERWVERAGEPADPLLWSHAMYLVLRSELEEIKGK